MAKARMTFDSSLIDWEIAMEEIPVSDGQGKEVTVNFKSSDIDNQDSFYTD